MSEVAVESLANAQATKQNIVGALQALASRTGQPTAVQPEDTVFVYYAGHGIAVEDRFYLLPHDLAFQGRMAELSAADVKALVASGISDEELERLFEPIDARIVLVIDACNSGQALETAERRRGPMNARGLAQLAFEKGMYVLTAAQAHQAALEVSNLGHGILTYVLIQQGLEKGQADAGRRDGLIEVREWLAHAVRGVPEQHRKLTQSSRQRGLELVSGVPSDSNLQRPRAFFRRQLEAEPPLVGRRR